MWDGTCANHSAARLLVRTKFEPSHQDAFGYGGSGVGNLGSVEAVPEPCHGQPASAVMTLPPLGALWLVPET